MNFYLAEITVRDVPIIFGGLIGFAIFAGGLWWFFRTGGDKAARQSAADWEGLANARLATIAERDMTIEGLKSHLAGKELELADCDGQRDKLDQQNLRLQARNESYERCINRLERRCGIAETDFNDPFQHITDISH
jgi:hypothetical protein